MPIDTSDRDKRLAVGAVFILGCAGIFILLGVDRRPGGGGPTESPLPFPGPSMPAGLSQPSPLPQPSITPAVFVELLAEIRVQEIVRPAAGGGCLIAYHVVGGSEDSIAISALAPLGEAGVLAVGHVYRTARGSRTLIMRFVDEQWHISGDPNIGIWDSILSDVSAIGPAEAWAVGSWVGPARSDTSSALVVRWDGLRWEPGPAPAAERLGQVVALAPDDVWAVGTSTNSRGALMHWDGSHWTEHTVTLYQPGQSLEGARLVRTAPGEVWAAGHNVLLKWDGRSWSEQPLPLLPFFSFWDVRAGPRGNLWAVGSASPNSYLARWEDRRWIPVDLPELGPEVAELSLRVVAPAEGETWVDGIISPSSSSKEFTPVLPRWDGSTWTNLSVPVELGSVLLLDALVSGQEVWFNGFRPLGGTSSVEDGVMLRYHPSAYDATGP